LDVLGGEEVGSGLQKFGPFVRKVVVKDLLSSCNELGTYLRCSSAQDGKYAVPYGSFLALGQNSVLVIFIIWVPASGNSVLEIDGTFIHRSDQR